MQRKHITLAPSETEMRLIRALYERARGIAVLDGIKPPSFSRYLIEAILRGEEISGAIAS